MEGFGTGDLHASDWLTSATQYTLCGLAGNCVCWQPATGPGIYHVLIHTLDYKGLKPHMDASVRHIYIQWCTMDIPRPDVSDSSYHRRTDDHDEATDNTLVI